MANYLILRSEDERERIFTRSMAAQLARITLDFLEECERAELIRAGRMPGGGPGYTMADVRNLARIRRLRQDLGLDLAAVEVVLHMRQRIVEMLREMEAIEAHMLRRERELQREIQRLRRHLAEDAEWQ